LEFQVFLQKVICRSRVMIRQECLQSFERGFVWYVLFGEKPNFILRRGLN
jgi:hypothetical protein